MLLLVQFFGLLPAPFIDIVGFFTFGATWILALIYALDLPSLLPDA